MLGATRFYGMLIPLPFNLYNHLDQYRMTL